MKALALALVLLAAAPAVAAAHRLRTPWPPHTPAPVGSTPNVLVQVAPARPAVLRLLRGSGGELLSRQLHLWRVRSGAAESLLPLLRLVGALQDAEPDRALRAPAAVKVSGDPLVPSEYHG